MLSVGKVGGTSVIWGSDWFAVLSFCVYEVDVCYRLMAFFYGLVLLESFICGGLKPMFLISFSDGICLDGSVLSNVLADGAVRNAT